MPVFVQLMRAICSPRSIAALMVAALAVSASQPASARTRVVVGVGIGGPVYGPPPVYYYPPPPVYYPPVVYAPAPPPVVYTPAPPPPAPVAAPAAPPPQTGNCREYRGDATIDGRNQPFYGTACLQPDGRWHIVN